MKKFFAMAAAAALLIPATAAHAARDQVWAAGSSTVFPFATRVAENYARKSGKRAPKVESLGTGGGFKLFCGGMGEGFPDIANASRPMKKSEFDACAAKGVKDIVEIKIGYDGIVVAVDKDGSDYNFKPEHLFLGLSQNILRAGKFQTNPYKTWDQVGAGLPGDRIVVYGPPPTSGTRDAFVELALEGGILGRADDMVVVRGVNLYPSAVENVVRSCGEIAEFRVETHVERALTEMSVQVEPQPGCADEAGLSHKVAAALQYAFGLRVAVSCVPAGTLPRFEAKAKRWSQG